MVVVAQLVRALDCGSRGRRFEPDLPPNKKALPKWKGFFYAVKRTYGVVALSTTRRFERLAISHAV